MQLPYLVHGVVLVVAPGQLPYLVHRVVLVVAPGQLPYLVHGVVLVVAPGQVSEHVPGQLVDALDNLNKESSFREKTRDENPTYSPRLTFVVPPLFFPSLYLSSRHQNRSKLLG